MSVIYGDIFSLNTRSETKTKYFLKECSTIQVRNSGSGWKGHLLIRLTLESHCYLQQMLTALDIVINTTKLMYQKTKHGNFTRTKFSQGSDQNGDAVEWHLSITDADEICDAAAVRDFSKSDAVFKSVINNTLKDFPQCKWRASAKNKRIA